MAAAENGAVPGECISRVKVAAVALGDPKSTAGFCGGLRDGGQPEEPEVGASQGLCRGESPAQVGRGEVYTETPCLSSSSAALFLFAKTPLSPEAGWEAGTMEIAK